MNDVPKNELLSAYLDDELTAVEQAEVERLLAADPAARQTLDELRALSATLQALPRQKLGEDLSPQVLRAVERRMLTGEGPGESRLTIGAPAPLTRSIFRRVLNPRGLVWAGLAVSVAVVILIHEQRQQGPLADRSGREVAVAPVVAEKSNREPGPPPSIRAAHDEEAANMAKPPPPTPVAKLPVDRSRIERADERAAGAAPAEPERRELPGRAGKTGPAATVGGMAESEPPATKRGPLVGKGGVGPDFSPDNALAAPAPKFFVKNQRKAGQKKSDGTPMSGGQNMSAKQEMLVVNCDISPDAFKQQTFDQLLVANSIPPQQQQRGRIDLSRDADVALIESKIAEKALQKATDDGKARPTKPKDSEVDLVYVEATPAQIEATIAGLSARPEVFLSVSIEPKQNESAQRFQRYARSGGGLRQDSEGGDPLMHRSKAAAPATTKADLADSAQKGGRAKAFGAAPSAAPQAPALPGGEKNQSVAAARQSAAEPQRAQSSIDAGRQLQTQFRSRQLAPSSSRQQVLFVLRVVDHASSVATSAKVRAAEQIDASKAAKIAPSPSQEPAQKKP